MASSLPPDTQLTFEELRAQAHRAIQNSSHTQRAVARTLDVDESSVSRACSEAGPKFQRLQRQILEEIAGVRIERRVRFVVRETP